MNPTIILKFLAFLGAHKKSVLLEFNQGLNVIYGASDTGKTYILQTIDFMLGAKEIRPIPEIRGYTDILLGIEISTGEKFTLLIYAELSGDFPLGDSRQPIYKSLRP
ncbi:AAA family ATPase, partial [Acinetobacter baumannii]